MRDILIVKLLSGMAPFSERFAQGMIDSIHIAGIATYGNTPEVLSELSKFNFLYGSNGAGKTTISKVIADEAAFSTCRMVWAGGTRLQAMVYNRDFVTKNFDQSTELKGVFTLGEKNKETLNKIATAKSELDKLKEKIEALTTTLQGEDGTGGKRRELADLELGFRNKCWEQKQKHDKNLQGAFEGFRNNADKFKGKVLLEKVSNSANLLTLPELEKKAATVFGEAPTQETSIPALDDNDLVALESNPILTKRVIGKADVDIAAMIQKLGNSDWVREGRAYYELNDKQCPFCQQSTTDALAASLNEYFDETFEKDSKAIESLETNYKSRSAQLQQRLDSILSAPSKFLDVEKVKAEKRLLDSKVTLNIQQIKTKRREPSQIVRLESLSGVLSAIKFAIDAANVQIAEHNKMVRNLAKERRDLTAQVWKFLLEVELKGEISGYETKKNNLNRAGTVLVRC